MEKVGPEEECSFQSSMSNVLGASFDGVELMPILHTARRRWRLLHATLYSIMAFKSTRKEMIGKFLSRSNSSVATPTGISEATSDETPLMSAPSIARKRWTLVNTTIYSTRAIISVGKEILSKRVLRTPSYTAIEVEPEGSEHFPGINQTKLSELVKERNAAQFLQLGGIEAIVAGLRTSEENGIIDDAQDVSIRKELFGSNSYGKPPEKAVHIWMRCVMHVCSDPVSLILLLCGAVSLGFGIKDRGLKGGSDGGSIISAVFLVILISAFSNFWPKNELSKLSQISINRQVNVTREGKPQHLAISDVVVGDIVRLDLGDQIPADGLYLDGHSFLFDESGVTGESDQVTSDRVNNPFLPSGAIVTSGRAKMLVTAVGMNTLRGKIASEIASDAVGMIHLHYKIKKLTSLVSNIGMLLAFLTCVALVTCYFTGKMHDDQGNRDFRSSKTSVPDVFRAIVGILATPVVIAAAAKPEGLLLAVTVSLAYSTKRMKANQALVRKLSACEAMGSVDVICTDITGLLSIRTSMKVTELRIGHSSIRGTPSSISQTVLQLLHQAIGLNKTQAQEDTLLDRTEQVIYEWGIEDLGMIIEDMTETCEVLHVEPFSTGRKQAGALIRKKADNTLHVHLKGAPESILAACSNYYDMNGIVNVINEDTKLNFQHKIQGMTNNGLRCIAYAHKQKTRDDESDDRSSPPELVHDDLTLLGFVCVRDARRQAVTDCQKAGVDLKMFTVDDMSIAKALAVECGIIKSDQDITSTEVIEAVEFENLTVEERMEKVDQIHVIARGSHRHKLLMVQCLKQKGRFVAVTGDVTADAMAFREANVGLCMGIHSSDTLKESSDVVILDGNFASVVKFLMWARGRYYTIQKLTVFYLTISVVSLVTDCVSAISAGEPITINLITVVSVGKVPYATLQLLWVKLIAGTLATMALAIEQPAKEIMQNPPIVCDEAFISNAMWRNMVAQAVYQIPVLLAIQLHGKSFFPAKVKDTMIFNTFVLFQIVMILNPSKLKNGVFKRGKEGEMLCCGILGPIIVLQVVMVEFLKRYAGTERLGWVHWGQCTGFAAGSWLISWIVEYIPVPRKTIFAHFRR